MPIRLRSGIARRSIIAEIFAPESSRAVTESSVLCAGVGVRPLPGPKSRACVSQARPPCRTGGGFSLNALFGCPTAATWCRATRFPGPTRAQRSRWPAHRRTRTLARNLQLVASCSPREDEAAPRLLVCVAGCTQARYGLPGRS